MCFWIDGLFDTYTYILRACNGHFNLLLSLYTYDSHEGHVVDDDATHYG